MSPTEPSVYTVMETVVSPVIRLSRADCGYRGSGVFTGTGGFMSAHCRRSMAPSSGTSNAGIKGIGRQAHNLRGYGLDSVLEAFDLARIAVAAELQIIGVLYSPVTVGFLLPL